MKLLLDVFRQNSKKVPIWLMRQAGRYLPEYREIRKKAGSFLDLCYNPELATAVTLQPIDRFDFDAAIIFSDILVIPHILGLDVEFTEGEGPRVETVKSPSDIKKLKVKHIEYSDKINRVCEAIALTKTKLNKEKTLIGFAGGPWTVATYIISEKKHDFDYCRKIALENGDMINGLIEILTEQTIIYLKEQINAGAEVIQLFESWAGILNEEEFERFVIKPTQKIVKSLRDYNPNIPIIGFPKGAGLLYEKYGELIDLDCIGLDYLVPFEIGKKIKQKKIIQGNLDPQVLLLTKDKIEYKMNQIMSNFSSGNFIFNLGHGINKETPIENVEYLVDYVRNYKE
ncbi:MAG: uroporphyrinogen decarboxylase [Rickettsiaceae bacterium]|nr:uroporphyrinogen decarboxylase [Rickettsiaceae bacterium]